MTALSLSPRTRKRLIDRGLDALTWLVLLVMLSPILWLVVSSLQTDGQLATGALRPAAPDVHGVQRRCGRRSTSSATSINSLIICTVAALLATAFARRPATRSRASSSAARGRSSLGRVGTQLIPGSLFLLPVFMGFIWLKQNTPIQPVRHPASG